MSCEKCKDLCVRFAIRQPHDGCAEQFKSRSKTSMTALSPRSPTPIQFRKSHLRPWPKGSNGTTLLAIVSAVVHVVSCFHYMPRRITAVVVTGNQRTESRFVKTSNMALNLAPFGRWALRDKAA